MARQLTAVAPLLLAAACTADAQSLGDAARKAQERRTASSGTTMVFDERDLDPSAAESELRQFAITESRWRQFLAADRQIGSALQRDPAIVARLKGLQATSVLALERFLKREPALLTALNAAAMEPHEFAFTLLSVGLVVALETRPADVPQIDDVPEVVAANAKFLKAHAREVQALAVPPDLLTLRIASLSSGAAVSRVAPEPSAGARAPAPSPVPTPAAGVPVADFTFLDFDGRARSLSDYRGRYVLLDFWGVWCPNCRAEVPYLKAAYAQFQSRGLEIIGMDYEKTASVQEVRQYLVANGIAWTFARADSVRDVIRNQFQIDGFPTQMLVDPNGVLVPASSSSLRGERLIKTLDRILPR